ncbi:glycogen operon protein [Alteromonadaceae bacterium 2753L.S.0a.02]|nr:glycogen operon protein [Alteromonadaceae bacterium 2753L.S.0a.02]
MKVVFKNKRNFTTKEGKAYPLGATVLDNGVNFALFSGNATRVDLCLFDEEDIEVARLNLKGPTEQVWHLMVEGLGAGAKYAYRVHGAFEPENGHRFNAKKLLLDPYARKLSVPFEWSNSLYAYELENAKLDLNASKSDSAASLPKCVVVDERSRAQSGEQGRPHKPRVAWCDTVLYECHVKGFTKLHPAVSDAHKGTFAGMMHPEVIGYLKDLGVTTVELLPVHQFVSEYFLIGNSLSNYWGYNTLCFFAVHPSYLSQGDISEFREMVDAYHEAGLEVVLDVVYNHTAEGNQLGPTLSLRGIDNISYYSLQAHDKRYYVNDTGCGNTLNLKHPRVLQLVMDSLRYWYCDVGVDGFRFDLATVLGRESYGFDSGAGFLDAVRQDPHLAGCKLIAEPWDIGPGGYQLGNFPSGWSEWNDRYRDTCRRYWRGDRGIVPEFARRIHGSSDFFEYSGRGPAASINFITSHDGFTLHDLVTYNQKHNELNKEENRDGHNGNFSYNYGEEGETKDPWLLNLRLRQKRNMLATLILSQGTPMILGGDEMNRSQKGNNNAYCQDNSLNWVAWDSIDRVAKDLQGFVSYVLSLRRKYPLLTAKRYIHRPDEPDNEVKCVVRWVNSLGSDMAESEWNNQDLKAFGWILEQYPVFCRIFPDDAESDSLFVEQEKSRILILFNSGEGDLVFKVPIGTPDADGIEANYWDCVLDTYESDGIPKTLIQKRGGKVLLRARSMQMLIAKF